MSTPAASLTLGTLFSLFYFLSGLLLCPEIVCSSLLLALGPLFALASFLLAHFRRLWRVTYVTLRGNGEFVTSPLVAADSAALVSTRLELRA